MDIDPHALPEEVEIKVTLKKQRIRVISESETYAGRAPKQVRHNILATYGIDTGSEEPPQVFVTLQDVPLGDMNDAALTRRLQDALERQFIQMLSHLESED